MTAKDLYQSMDRETAKDLRAYTVDRIKRAVLTLRAAPDRERQWLMSCARSSMPEAVQSITDAYGYESTRSIKFRPTPTDVDLCLPTYAWLTWLQKQNDGRRAYKLLIAHVHGVPKFRLSQRYHCSESSIDKWRAHAIDIIVNEFASEILPLVPVKEVA